jgi:hypothetical protein
MIQRSCSADFDWVATPAHIIPKMAASQDDNDDLASLDLFQDPEGFYQPEKPATFTTYVMKNGRRLDLRLVGHSPLWVGHSHHFTKRFVC